MSLYRGQCDVHDSKLCDLVTEVFVQLHRRRALVGDDKIDLAVEQVEEVRHQLLLLHQCQIGNRRQVDAIGIVRSYPQTTARQLLEADILAAVGTQCENQQLTAQIGLAEQQVLFPLLRVPHRRQRVIDIHLGTFQRPGPALDGDFRGEPGLRKDGFDQLQRQPLLGQFLVGIGRRRVRHQGKFLPGLRSTTEHCRDQRHQNPSQHLHTPVRQPSLTTHYRHCAPATVLPHQIIRYLILRIGIILIHCCRRVLIQHHDHLRIALRYFLCCRGRQ